MNASVLQHKNLVSLLQKAYSAEKAAAFAYIGHRNSVKSKAEKLKIQEIEIDEWNHRKEVLSIMKHYQIPISRFQEFRFHIIGKTIGYSCHIIGWFMPYFFAGRLESGNVCEYFRIMQYFHELNIYEHNNILFEMGIKEKEHEVYFLEQVQNKRLMPLFEKVFGWGIYKSFNDVDLNAKYPISESAKYCKNTTHLSQITSTK